MRMCSQEHDLKLQAMRSQPTRGMFHCLDSSLQRDRSKDWHTVLFVREGGTCAHSMLIRCLRHCSGVRCHSRKLDAVQASKHPLQGLRRVEGLQPAGNTRFAVS
jgi:hypothetical protein